MVGFCSSPRYVEHLTGQHHPERPDRIRAIYAALSKAGMLEGPNPFPAFALDFGPLRGSGHKLLELAPEPADERWLLLVHSPQHVEHVKHVCQLGEGTLDLGDTTVMDKSYEIALLALGGLLKSADAVMKGQVNAAFAAVRPPGHHAEPGRSMGFCLFSNLAITARYIQKVYNVGRVAIVDFDVHHGNGTQAALEEDPTVHFVSLHQHPRTCYPGTGAEWENGRGAGAGHTLNIPFMPGAGDADYLKAMEQKVLPALDRFKPQVLLIDAGFDAHADDPLAQIELSEEGFEQMTRLLSQFAQQHCGGRIVSALEGGYDLRALGRCVVRHLLALGA